MSEGLAAELVAALTRNGIKMAREPDTQTVTLPFREAEVEVPRIHPAWQLYEGRETVAGIPNKNRVAGPALITAPTTSPSFRYGEPWADSRKPSSMDEGQQPPRRQTSLLTLGFSLRPAD